jgi:hypothetical protein
MQKAILQKLNKNSVYGTKYFCPSCQMEICDHSDKDQITPIPLKTDRRVRGFDDI